MTQRLRHPGERTRESYGSGKVQGFVCFVFVCGGAGGGGGGFWSLFILPPITSCSPWHRGKEFAIWRRPGCTLDMAAPAGLQWRPGACIGSVYWLGDKFPVVFWEVWAQGGGVSFGGNGRDEVLRWWHPVNICLTTLQRRSDIWERYANMSRAPAIISMLSPAYQCLKHPLVLSD